MRRQLPWGPVVGRSRDEVRARSAGEHTLGWGGLGLLGTLWVWAHWSVSSTLDRLDRAWNPPALVAPIETAVLVVVGLLASVGFVAIVQFLFRRRLASWLADVAPRQQTLVALVPAVCCLVLSYRFRVMLVGPALLIALNLAQLARGLPPSTPAGEVFGWAGRAVGRAGRGTARAIGRGASGARRAVTRRRAPRPPL